MLDEVRQRTAQARTRMVNRDQQVNPLILFAIGDLVSLRIPRKDRHATDNKRILCRIISIPHPGLYKLQTEYGILEKQSPVRELESVVQSLTFVV